MFRLKKELSTHTDEQLMQLLSTRRSNEALTELHARYSKKVLGFFLRMVRGDVEKAQDLVQDLFMRILEKHHLFDPTRRFYSWMFTIASNMCKTSFRIKTYENIDEGSRAFEGQFAHSDNELDKEVFRRSLQSAIEQLEDHHRMTFILRYMEELSVKEIAEITESSEGTVKSRLYYASRKIAKALKEFDPKNSEEIFKLY